MCPPRVVNCPKRAKAQAAQAKTVKSTASVKSRLEPKEVVYNGYRFIKKDENRGENT